MSDPLVRYLESLPVQVRIAWTKAAERCARAGAPRELWTRPFSATALKYVKGAELSRVCRFVYIDPKTLPPSLADFTEWPWY